MIARASPGSRSCSSSVDPLMSANSAVTVLRSPSSVSGEVLSGATRIPGAKPGGIEDAAAAPASLASRAPHLPQKSEVVGLSDPHFAQCFASAFPHFAQKLFVEGLFVPHFEQRIDREAPSHLDARVSLERWLKKTTAHTPDAAKAVRGSADNC